MRGYKDETNFQQHQHLPHEVKMPSELGTYQPKNLFSHDQKNYVDTHANSKYYFPQDYEPQYTNTNIYNNKPINDISNQQNLYLSQFERPGLADPYGSQQVILIKILFLYCRILHKIVYLIRKSHSVV